MWRCLFMMAFVFQKKGVIWLGNLRISVKLCTSGKLKANLWGLSVHIRSLSDSASRTFFALGPSANISGLPSDWRLKQGLWVISPKTPGIGSSAPCHPQKDKRMQMDERPVQSVVVALLTKGKILNLGSQLATLSNHLQSRAELHKPIVRIVFPGGAKGITSKS